jgi:hypothetical protein
MNNHLAETLDSPPNKLQAAGLLGGTLLVLLSYSLENLGYIRSNSSIGGLPKSEMVRIPQVFLLFGFLVVVATIVWRLAEVVNLRELSKQWTPTPRSSLARPLLKATLSPTAYRKAAKALGINEKFVLVALVLLLGLAALSLIALLIHLTV